MAQRLTLAAEIVNAILMFFTCVMSCIKVGNETLQWLAGNVDRIKKMLPCYVFKRDHDVLSNRRKAKGVRRSPPSSDEALLGSPLLAPTATAVADVELTTQPNFASTQLI